MFVFKLGLTHLPQRLNIAFSLFSISSQLVSVMVVCYCGKIVVVRTSWTQNNPGRRFFGCPLPVKTFNFIFLTNVVP